MIASVASEIRDSALTARQPFRNPIPPAWRR
jgi:hypothetical protein